VGKWELSIMNYELCIGQRGEGRREWDVGMWDVGCGENK
jgi:hypothetical protein